MTSKLDLTKPYRTRDGREAHAVAGPDGRLYGWAGQPGSGYDAESWRDDGMYWPEEGISNWDLVNVPETRTVKVQLAYRRTSYGRHYWTAYEDPEHMLRENKTSPAQTIACIDREITFTVGEGLGE